MGRSVRRSVVLAAVLAAGATVTVVSGATGAPVAGVNLTIGGQTVVTDGGGQARVPAAAPLGTMIDLTHPSHLDRQTRVRTSTGERFTLWPRTTPDGLDEHYTAKIVYTDSVVDPPAAVAALPLFRLPQGTDTMVLVPSAELLADGAAMEAHAAAARSATDSTGGRVRVVLSPTAVSVGNSIVVTSRIDAADPECVANRVRAYMDGNYGNFVVVSGEIVYCSMQIARSSTVVHELGHAFGLQHAPSGSNDVMEPAFSSRRAAAFGPRESLVLRMMLDRDPGNRFPDSDRGLTVSTRFERRRIVCH